jgi:hypothetical protein
MNKLLAELPTPRGRFFAARAPLWLTRLLRLLSACFGCATLWFSARGWSDMPVWAQLLAGVLVPAFFLMAFHPRGWARLSSVPFFQADEAGMYFPSQRNNELGRASRWLFVPWEGISNIRVDRCFAGLEGSDADGSSPCAAFDVIATPDEIAEYFVAALTKEGPVPGVAVPVAFYASSPPLPGIVIERLLELREHP